jgi:hypothetical protein
MREETKTLIHQNFVKTGVVEIDDGKIYEKNY